MQCFLAAIRSFLMALIFQFFVVVFFCFVFVFGLLGLPSLSPERDLTRFLKGILCGWGLRVI